MKRNLMRSASVLVVLTAMSAWSGCRDVYPHSFVWPNTGDQGPTHPKPPEGGYYTNWDPYAAELTLEPADDVNPVRTQHMLVATVKDKEGRPLPNRRVEWIISQGSVGDIVEVDESGWRLSRGYKMTNTFAVSHTNNGPHVLTRGNDDPSDDISLTKGQTWCVITSPIEGTTYITAYAPGIYDWNKHKAFAVKKWMDVRWECPPPATNPVGTTHTLNTKVTKFSDGTPLAGYIVTYKLLDGPAGVLSPGDGAMAQVRTDAQGVASVTLRQTTPAEGTNNISVDILRPGMENCCKPPEHIATCNTSKTWIAPKIAIKKSCTPRAEVGDTFAYTINVNNPSNVDATNAVVTDALPGGIEFVSADPAPAASGSNLSWNLGTVNAGGTRTINVQARATHTGTFENCAEVRADMGLSGRDCCQTIVSAPALALELQCGPEALLCDPINVRVVVRNTGDGVAKNVMIRLNMPAGLTMEDGRTSVSFRTDVLPGGAAKEATFRAKAQNPGDYTVTASATADPNVRTNDATCTVKVTKPVIDVAVSCPAKRYIGRPATCEVTACNRGSIQATDVVVVADVPAGTDFVSATDGGSASGGRITWNLGTMAPGACKTLKFDVVARTPGTGTTKANARAYCAEAAAETKMDIEGVTGILVEVVDDPDPIEVGGQTTYDIRVTNQGSAPDEQVVVVIELPAQEEFVSATGPTNFEASGKMVKFAPVATIGAKQTISYRVVVKAVSQGDARFVTKVTTVRKTEPIQEVESTTVYE